MATGQDSRQGRSGIPKVQGLDQSKEGAGPSHSHFSPSLSQDKLTGGLLLMLTHVKFKASPGRSADALARIVRLVGGTLRRAGGERFMGEEGVPVLTSGRAQPRTHAPDQLRLRDPLAKPCR